jgi:hypothetical protein
MPKEFNIFSGGREEKNVKIVKGVLASHAPSGSRPASAVKRPSSANYNGGGSKNKLRMVKPQQQEAETSNHTTRYIPS